MDVQMSAKAGAFAAENLCSPKGWLARGRPVPATFVEMAKTKGPSALKAHFRANPNTIDRWYVEAGVERVVRRTLTLDPPADFAEVAARLTPNAMAYHYRRGHSVIKRWLTVTGIEPAKPQPKLSGNALGKPVPDDFRTRAPQMSRSALERHYSVHGNTIQRWLRLSGVRALRYVRGGNFGGHQAGGVPSVDASAAAQAAQFLRTRLIVYRCDILTTEERAKLPDRGRGLWYINGRGAVPAADMIALAEAKGFDARAWARI